MHYREKVIRHITAEIEIARMCKKDFASVDIDILSDVLALLKEQEAKPPAIMQDVKGIWSTCSICGHKLRAILAMEMNTYFPKFCSECGQAVKWNERSNT